MVLVGEVGADGGRGVFEGDTSALGGFTFVWCGVGRAVGACLVSSRKSHASVSGWRELVSVGNNGRKMGPGAGFPAGRTVPKSQRSSCSWTGSLAGSSTSS